MYTFKLMKDGDDTFFEHKTVRLILDKPFDIKRDAEDDEGESVFHLTQPCQGYAEFEGAIQRLKKELDQALSNAKKYFEVTTKPTA